LGEISCCLSGKREGREKLSTTTTGELYLDEQSFREILSACLDGESGVEKEEEGSLAEA